MKVIEFLIGVPASGKSTYAKSKLHPNPWHAEVARVNKDDIRKANPGIKEKEVLRIQEEMIVGYANQQYKKIIVDNTHLNPIHETKIRDLAKQLGYEFEVKWFDDSLDPDLCHKRNIARADTVPHTVIENMYHDYFRAWMKREGHELKKSNNMRRAIIVDLDGTVAHNDGHRGWYDWKAVGRDDLHEDIADLVKMLYDKGHFVVFLSGRDSVCRQETSAWISNHFRWLENNWVLFMRKEDDMRKDSFVKFELFMNHVNGVYDIKYVLDDRLQVVRMWRALGLRCLQVDNGWK